MLRRALRDDLALTEVAVGTAALGNLYQETSDDDAAAALARAWEAGVRYFDTAPHYGLGLAERRLGIALAAWPREEVVVSTKVGRLLQPRSASPGDRDPAFAVPATHDRVWDFSRRGVIASLESSLQRLGTNAVDIAYLHDPDDHLDIAFAEGMPALLALREQGLVRAVGVAMNQVSVPAEFIRRFDIDVVMIAGRYTLLDRSAETELLPLARERGIGVVAAAAYNSGLLSADHFDESARFDYAEPTSAVSSRARRIYQMCERFGVPAPAAAVQFPLRNDTVRSVVAGVRTEDEAAALVDRYRTVVPDELWARLGATDRTTEDP
ncbi:D-threo-aldose 1-dehydrogenase [Microbacterium sp. AK009]|uniref:aldo/keto reductase n=1 Tax=Microbacterium sp. AK009 TaxID=2723068 RepID=UPI0015CCD611|nr:aldo/keto reductase [Microbacterium sp. AK009]NYF16601.1 D-threo-aldose 1-dehydrogenase [Microbacterium sp. AK009]